MPRTRAGFNPKADRGRTHAEAVHQVHAGLESAEPRFDESLQTVIAKTENYIAQSVTTKNASTAAGMCAGLPRPTARSWS
jgi:hypothetical protein